MTISVRKIIYSHKQKMLHKVILNSEKPLFIKNHKQKMIKYKTLFY